MSAAPIPQGDAADSATWLESLASRTDSNADAACLFAAAALIRQQAAALAASEARCHELESRLQQFMDRTAAAEQSLAEAVKLLRICASAIDAACPMQGPETRKLRQRIDALLPKGEGATS